MTTIDVRLSRFDRVYRPSDVVEGHVVVSSSAPIAHQGVRLTATGSIIMQPSSKSIGVLESLYNSVKPIQFMNKVLELCSAGKLPAGKVEMPFHIALDTKAVDRESSNGFLYETYHGAHINIQYVISVEMPRGYLAKPLFATLEFIVEGKQEKVPRLPISPRLVSFYITQDTQKHDLLPSIRSGGFRVTGKVATQCSLSEPIMGELIVEASAVPIYSIDIKLLRIESIAVGERMATERSEIQTTQLADGDICRKLALPIYVILPRLFTCPTLSAGSFSLEFELTIVISFDTGTSKKYIHYEPNASKQSIALETLPLRLVRT